MIVYILLKECEEGSGHVTFHGVTSNETAASVWASAGEEYFSYAVGDEDEDPEFIQMEPVTQN